MGKISGAVGTYANVDPKVEAITCQELGLASSPASTQVVQRDRHAEVLSTLAILGSTWRRLRWRSGVPSVPRFASWRSRSGAGRRAPRRCPTRGTPILAERLCGMARLPAPTPPSASNSPSGRSGTSPTPRRNASYSPTPTILAFYMLRTTTRILRGLEVHEDRMLENLNSGGGIVFSGRVLLALVEAGMIRDDAYSVVQGAAMRAW